MAIGRFIGGTIKGTAKVAGAAVGGAALMAGFNPLAMAARMDTGLGGVFAAGMAGKKLFQSGFKKSKGGGTDKDEVINETSIVGPTGKMLAKVHKEVVAVKGLLIDTDPASAAREAAFEEEHRHRRLIAALSGLGGGGPGGPGKDKGSFFDWLKGLLPLLLAGLGLALLPKLLEKLPAIFDGLQDAVDAIGKFLNSMLTYFAGLRILGKSFFTKATAARTTRANRSSARRSSSRGRPHSGSRWTNRWKNITGKGGRIAPEKITSSQKNANRIKHAKTGVAGESVVEDRARTNRSADKYKQNQERLRKAQERLAMDKSAAAEQNRFRRQQRLMLLEENQRVLNKEINRKATAEAVRRANTGDTSFDKRSIDRHAGLDRTTRARLAFEKMAGGLKVSFQNLRSDVRLQLQRVGVTYDKVRTNVSRVEARLETLSERFTKLRGTVDVLRRNIFNRAYAAGEFDTGGRRRNIFNRAYAAGEFDTDSRRRGGGTGRKAVETPGERAAAREASTRGTGRPGMVDTFRNMGANLPKVFGRGGMVETAGARAKAYGGYSTTKPKTTVPEVTKPSRWDRMKNYTVSEFKRGFSKQLTQPQIVEQQNRWRNKNLNKGPSNAGTPAGRAAQFMDARVTSDKAANSGFIARMLLKGLSSLPSGARAWGQKMTKGFIRYLDASKTGMSQFMRIPIIGPALTSKWALLVLLVYEIGLLCWDYGEGTVTAVNFWPQVLSRLAKLGTALLVFMAVGSLVAAAIGATALGLVTGAAGVAVGVAGAGITLVLGKLVLDIIENKGGDARSIINKYKQKMTSVYQAKHSDFYFGPHKWMGLTGQPGYGQGDTTNYAAGNKAARLFDGSRGASSLQAGKAMGGGMMSGADYSGAAGKPDENKLAKALANHQFYARMLEGDHLTLNNRKHIGNKMALAGVEVYKILHSGKFSKRVTIILQNTAFNNVNVPHIIDNTSVAVSNMTVGPTIMSGVR